MNGQLEAFIARVETFEIDSDDKTLRFVDRLARENRWTVAYASRVIREYLRFCVLAMQSGHPVTPSEAVDQAWHLHLTYTRSYWERFCGDVLGRPLHHEPTAGGPQEQVKFQDWYQATLDSYRKIFGSDPPQDIWPLAEQRFTYAGELKWMNAGREWAVPKRTAIFVAGAVVCGLAALVVGLDASDGSHDRAAPHLAAAFFPFDLGGTQFLIFYAVLALVGIVVVLSLCFASVATEESDARTNARAELDTDELAVLAGGGSRLAHVSLTRLFAEGRIEAVKTLWRYSKFTAVGPPPAQPAVDRDLYTAIESGKSTNNYMKAVKPHFERAETVLVGNGLRYAGVLKSKAAAWIIIVIGAVGGLRVVQGLVLGEEVGLLTIMVILFVIVAAAMNLRWSRTTPQGKAHLENAKAAIDPEQLAGESIEPAMLAYSVALLGTAAIEELEHFAPLASLMPSIGRSNASSGCGAGCSGCGGGGCGGGGCGGCGG